MPAGEDMLQGATTQDDASSAGPKQAAAAFVDLRDVSFVYGRDDDEVLALEGLTLSVAEGEFVAVVGPSGCGKSTLMGRHRPRPGRARHRDSRGRARSPAP